MRWKNRAKQCAGRKVSQHRKGFRRPQVEPHRLLQPTQPGFMLPTYYSRTGVQTFRTRDTFMDELAYPQLRRVQHTKGGRALRFPLSARLYWRHLGTHTHTDKSA